jgi:hypothetical protein
MNAIKQWFHSVEWKHGFMNIGTIINQAANVILGNPFSRETYPDETICCRAGRMKSRGQYNRRRLILNWIFEHVLRQGPNHCENAWAKEKDRYHQHPDSRKFNK